MHPIEPHPIVPIDEALEDCRLRLARGETIENCLTAHPSHADELAALLPIAVETSRLAREPDPAYAAAARRRFRAAVAATRVEERANARSRSGWLRRLALPAALVLVVGLSGGGLVTASANDDVLPDSPLYAVKQTRESVAQFVRITPNARLSYQARLIGRRVAELEEAERLHKPPFLIRQIATNMVRLTNQATDEIASSPEPTRANLVKRARPLLRREHVDLQRAGQSAPPTLKPLYHQLDLEILADDRKLSS